MLPLLTLRNSTSDHPSRHLLHSSMPLRFLRMALQVFSPPFREPPPTFIVSDGCALRGPRGLGDDTSFLALSFPHFFCKGTLTKMAV